MPAHAPAIVLSSLDADRLEQMLDTPPYRDAPGAAQLRAELERAQVVESASLPSDVVSMNTTAECVDDASGQQHRLTLVYPRDADAAHGRVSVLAPVGSALLGMRVGQSIDWPTPGGRTLKLRVTAIHHQPEASGQASR